MFLRSFFAPAFAARAIGGAAVILVLAASCARPALAEGNPARGKKLYEDWCVGCHGDDGAARNFGPGLAGLIGRRAGTVGGTPYGKSLYEANIVWSETTLDRYLASPTDEVHGTIMPIGVHDTAERRDLIAYLKTLR
jgi:cytochrome c